MGMWFRGLLVALLAAGPVWAEDIALVIGNRDYDLGARVDDADRVVGASAALRDGGVSVVGGQDAGLRDMRALVSQFEQMAPASDALAVVLAGRFVQGGNDTYFLPVDSDLPGLTALPSQSLPLSSVLQILSGAPGRAVLVLADDSRNDAQGPYLRDGIGEIDVPQGVTLAQGSPADAARFLRRTLAVRGAPLDADDTMRLSGYLPQGHSFLVTETGDPGGNPARAEVKRLRLMAERASREASDARDDLARADAAIWAEAEAEDTDVAYQRYLSAFPEGSRRDEASRALRAIADEPFRAARLTEEALRLGREKRRAIQRDLTTLGFNTRGVDGLFGNGTRSAIRRWQSDLGQTASGYLDEGQIRQLDNAAARRTTAIEAEQRAQAEANAREDDAFWQSLGGQQARPNALRSYLDRYPSGRWADTARARLDAFAANRRTDEKRRNRQEDEAFWRQSGADKTVPGLQAYLRRHPDGLYAGFARKELDRLNGDLGGNRDSARVEEDGLGLIRPLRQAVEDRLAGLGLDPGRVDGKFDDNTRAAMRQYQSDAGLPVTGFLSEPMLVQLLADSVRNLLRR